MDSHAPQDQGGAARLGEIREEEWACQSPLRGTFAQAGCPVLVRAKGRTEYGSPKSLTHQKKSRCACRSGLFFPQELYGPAAASP